MPTNKHKIQISSILKYAKFWVLQVAQGLSSCARALAGIDSRAGAKGQASRCRRLGAQGGSCGRVRLGRIFLPEGARERARWA
jgi:hypothetical protein